MNFDHYSTTEFDALIEQVLKIKEAVDFIREEKIVNRIF